MILPLTTVVTMAISDGEHTRNPHYSLISRDVSERLLVITVNKLLMLQYEPLIDTLVMCLCLDNGNNRKGQKGVDALQDASTDIILQLALFEPGASQQSTFAPS